MLAMTVDLQVNTVPAVERAREVILVITVMSSGATAEDQIIVKMLLATRVVLVPEVIILRITLEAILPVAVTKVRMEGILREATIQRQTMTHATQAIQIILVEVVL